MKPAGKPYPSPVLSPGKSARLVAPVVSDFSPWTVDYTYRARRKPGDQLQVWEYQASNANPPVPDLGTARLAATVTLTAGDTVTVGSNA